MKNCFLAMSINILNIILIVVLRYSQISVQLLEHENLKKTLFTSTSSFKSSALLQKGITINMTYSLLG